MSGSTKVLALVMVIALCGCGGETPTDAGYRVSGYAHAGPVCPVQQNPPNPACADRPVAGATLLILDEAGNQVTSTQTDDAGEFEVSLPAGTFTLAPQPVEGLLGTAPSQTFTTGPGLASVLDVAYDTGIR